MEHSQFELESGEPDNRDRSLVIDEHLEEYNDYVWVKGHSKGKLRFPERLRRKHIYSKYHKACYKFRTGDTQDWAEVHICTVRRYVNGKIFMYDNQTDKPKQLFSSSTSFKKHFKLENMNGLIELKHEYVQHVFWYGLISHQNKQ